MNHDPTILFRQGTRKPEGRYQAEIIFRNRLADNPTNKPETISRYAEEAIIAAALFEEAWIVAAMDKESLMPDSVADDELRIYEVAEPTK